MEQCDAWAYMTSSGTGLLVFNDDVTEGRSSQKNSEVYKDILSAQIKPNAAKMIHNTNGQWGTLLDISKGFYK